MSKVVLALDLGGTNARFAAIRRDGEVLARARATTPRFGTAESVLQMMSGGANPGSYEGGGLTALVLGLSRTSWLGVPLPWTPSTIALLGGGACGDLMVSGDAVVNTPYLMPPALVTMSVVIPNVPALIGTTIYAQSIAYRVTRHFTFGIEFGDGGEARIGT